MARSISPLAAIVICLAALAASEVWHQTGPAAPPEKPAPAPLPRFDLTMPPKAIFDSCRKEGKDVIAQRSADGDWTFDCVDADLRKPRRAG